MVGFIQVRRGDCRVHLCSFGGALAVVVVIRVCLVHSGLPRGQRVHLGSFGRALGVVVFIRGSFGCALGIVGFIQVRWVDLSAPWWSLGSFRRALVSSASVLVF